MDTPLPLNTSLPTVPRTAESPAAGASGLLADGVVIKGRYRVIRHIAGGGMGDVYEVFDDVSREPRAVKVMKSHLLDSPEARERFLKEARIQDLRHPHLVKTIDVDEWPERKVLFIAMELAPGKTLREWMRDQAAGDSPAFSVADSLEICRQVCAGLAFAHRTTIHRDIKPENILLERKAEGGWHARIADFGIARLLDAGHRTQTSQSFGTFQYMAPEQHRDAASVDHRADIYSVGVVLYELLTNQLPVGHFPLPSETSGSIPRDVDPLIKRSLAASPGARYADAAMMLADLERIAGVIGGSSEPRPREAVPVDLKNVNLGQIVVELQERRLAQVEVPGLPPIPENILRLRAELEDLDQALADLEQEIHPALRPHQETLRQIEEQYAAVLEETEQDPLCADSSLRRRLEQVLQTGAAIDSTQLQKVCGDLTDVSSLLETITRLQHVQNASEAMQRARKQYTEARDAELARLSERRGTAELALMEACHADLRELLGLIGLNSDSSGPLTLPLDGWSRMSRLITQQGRYQWNQWEAMSRAEAVWKSARTQSDAVTRQPDSSHRPEAETAKRARSRTRVLLALSVALPAVSLLAFFASLRTSDLEAPYAAIQLETQARQRAATTELNRPVEWENSIGMKFRLIPPGEFLMGSPESEAGRDSDEKQHRVRITRPFYCGIYPVTQAEYQAVMGSNPSFFQGSQVGNQNTSQFPVEQVSWNDAQEFLKRLSSRPGESGVRYRLLTEAEWEYCCRAGTSTAWFFGNDAGLLGEFAWFDGNAKGVTHAVGEKRPNPWGLHDMPGNVWEWCADWYASDYYSSSPEADPPGPPAGSSRVVRGGSFFGEPHDVRCASRGGYDPSNRNFDVGFRIVVES